MTRAYHRHGMTGTKIWKLWNSMILRCSYAGAAHYARYGGRGIAVCERWKTFENFYADMGDRPPGRTLDRKDNNGPYSPDNCRWSTHQEQGANRHNNRLLTYRGETKTATQWARELGLSPVTVNGRLQRGASVEAALQPVSASKRVALRVSAPPNRSA